MNNFAVKHSEAASSISEVYYSSGRLYLNIIIDKGCYNYSFYVRHQTY